MSVLLKVKSRQITLLLCGMWVSECGQEIIIWGISTEFGTPDIMIICELTLTLEQSSRVHRVVISLCVIDALEI